MCSGLDDGPLTRRWRSPAEAEPGWPDPPAEGVTRRAWLRTVDVRGQRLRRRGRSKPSSGPRDAPTTADELFQTVAAEVRKAIPYDGAMWFGVDPATMLAVAPALIEQLDDGYCDVFWHGEFHEHDANLFSDLARRPLPAASLRATTGDHPQRSARYRDFLRPQGYDDELRTVFRCSGSSWAIAALMREPGRRPFDEHDVALFGAISGIVAAAMRALATLVPPPTRLVQAPGLLLFDGDGVLVSVNTEAARWLADIFGADQRTRLGRDALADPNASDLVASVPIVPLLARARAVAAGRDDGQARLRLRDRGGRWVVLHASVLDGATTKGSVAVVVEPAKSAEIAPIIIEAYGLTVRERDVVQSIARGSSTPEIATELFLSAHTVRDYIKSVFDKVGVNSRAELIAKLFAEHYINPMHDGLVHID